MIESDYYNLLGIERGANKTEIKRAYYSQIKIYSPEKDPERFKALRAAYEFLSDDAKRAGYDKYGAQPDKIAGVAQEAARLMHNAQFAEAIEFLKKERRHLKSDVLSAILAEAYLGNGNTGMAVNAAEELFELKPDDPDVRVLLAKAYQYRGYNTKAIDTISEAADRFPDNPAVLDRYIRANMAIYDTLPPDIFDRVEPVADKLAAYSTDAIFLCLQEAMHYDRIDKISMLYSHYADGLMSAKTISENQYENAVLTTADLIYVDECYATAERLSPFLLKHKFRGDQKANLDKISNMIELRRLKNNNELDETLADYLILLNDLTTADKGMYDRDKFMMEYCLVDEPESVRRSLIKLRDAYPQFFELNRAFFMDLLNPAMHRKLKASYEKKRKQYKLGDTDRLDSVLDMFSSYLANLPEKERAKLEKELIKKKDDFISRDSDNPFDGDYFDESFEREEPYVRTERKVGRNEPCPCGSGKKYKHCCGRAGAQAANQ